MIVNPLLPEGLEIMIDIIDEIMTHLVNELDRVKHRIINVRRSVLLMMCLISTWLCYVIFLQTVVVIEVLDNLLADKNMVSLQNTKGGSEHILGNVEKYAQYSVPLEGESVSRNFSGENLGWYIKWILNVQTLMKYCSMNLVLKDVAIKRF